MEGVSTMKQKKLVVHFGAGALGRGLVVPMLYDSGCRMHKGNCCRMPTAVSCLRIQIRC